MILKKSLKHFIKQNRRTPLLKAVMNGHPMTALLILEKGADINAVDIVSYFLVNQFLFLTVIYLCSTE